MPLCRPFRNRSPKEWWELVPLAVDPSKLPKLPTEVWERILDELDALDWNDRPGYRYYSRGRTFAACCSVCQVWVPRSRYHLFKYVEVRSKEQAKEVSNLLHSIPALRTRVEELTVIGSDDKWQDASWIGLVGFYLGPKLKALELIQVEGADLSLMKLEDYQFWGAFNQAWRPGARRQLKFSDCEIAHANQLIRLAFVTKAEELSTAGLCPNDQAESVPSVPTLSSGISLPLQRLDYRSGYPDLIFPIPWHTLPKQCPSLSSVYIDCGNTLDPSSPDGPLFLVSVLHMLHSMQRRNDTNDVTLDTFDPPMMEMRTRPCDRSANAGDAPPAGRPRLRRELVLRNPPQGDEAPSLEEFAEALTLLEDAMMLTNYTNRRFHYIEIVSDLMFKDLEPDSLQSIDSILSRLCIATHDVHMVIKGKDRPYKGCVLPWARERFPLLTEIAPKAFCDLEAGWLCESHLEQASDDKEEWGSDSDSDWILDWEEREETEGDEGEEERMAGEAMEVDLGQPEGIQARMSTGKRRAMAGPETEDEGVQGKRRRAE